MSQLLKKAFLAILFSAPFFLSAQNLTGIWQGTVRQEDGAAAHEFPITIYIVQTGDQLAGTTWSYLDLRPYFSEKKFMAVKTGAAISFQETEILGENLPEGSGPLWGLSIGNLRHDPEADSLTGELVFQKQGLMASTGAAQAEPFVRASIRLSR